MKKTAKKLSSLILTLAFLLAWLPGGVQAADSLWETKTLDDGTLAITGYRGLASDIEIPSSIGGVAVTQISSNAFRKSDFLVSVVIPSSVTTIGYEAFFGCTALVTADLTEGLCELHNRAFGSCALTHIYIPSTLTSLHAANAGDAPFSGCSSLDAVTFAPGITELPYSLLRGCTGLTSIDIPNTVTTIGDFAFSGCTNLRSVRIPSSVETIGGSAFSGCTALAELSIPNSVTSVGSSAFQGCTSLTTLSIPCSVESIGYAAFHGCTGLTSVRLSEGLVSLGAQAFKDCTGLTGVHIPSTLKNVSASNHADGIFSGCTALTSVSFSPELTAIPYSLLRGCPGITSLTIPDTIEKIGGYAFAGCTSLKTVRISSSVTAIPGSAFAGCTALSSVHIPDGVTSIGSSAFQGCTSLKTLSVPGSVTLIDGAAFAGCTALTTVTLSEGLRSMGTVVFKGCTALKSINIPASLTFIGASNAEDGSFRNCPALETLTLSPEATLIPKNLLRGCQSVTYLHIPAAVTTIGNYAFNSCTGLTDIYYDADETSWAAITVKSGNTELNDVTIHYNAVPTVTSVAANKTAAAVGEAITWTAKASGGIGDLQYYFILYKDGTKLKTRSYSTSKTFSYTPAETGTYKVKVYVKDSLGTKVYKTGKGVAVTAVAKPVITTQPSAKTAAAGAKATFKVAATGEGLTYQWQYKTAGSSTWKDKSGATKSSYTVTAKESYNGIQYRCVVSNAGGSVTSSAATLTVTISKPVITTQPKAQTAAAGETATYKVVASGTGLTYQWQYSNDYGKTWHNKTGATKSSYIVTVKASYNGMLYRCKVTNSAGTVISSKVRLTVSGVKPKILSQPAAQTAAAGESVTFKVVAAGVGMTYQWQYKTAGSSTWKDKTGATSASYTVTAKESYNGIQYRCVVTNSIGSVTSEEAKLTVN